MFFTRRRFMKSAGLAGTFLASHFKGLPIWAAPLASPSPCLLHVGSGYAPFIDSFLHKIQPGADVFITEKYAAELEVWLRAWSEAFIAGVRDLRAVHAVLPDTLDGSLLGNANITPLRSQPPVQSEKVIFPSPQHLSSTIFVDSLRQYLAPFRRIEVSEFRMHRIEVAATAPLRVKTRIHYDLLGELDGNRREERTGEWELTWEQSSSDKWRVLSWSADSEMRARLTGPGFVDITAASFADVPSYHEQMQHGIDYWRTIVDGATGIDVYGNNGICAGDYDGDGYDDLYVCQPAGLPNRLYHNRGDGTFVDVTEKAGVGVLDGTSSAIFADLNNNGHQDLIVVRASGPLLFVNRGNGTFELKPDAFQFARPAQGSFTGVAAADYDRDGLLDVYFCTYSFYQGLSDYEYPRPYYDAQNGPPNFLLRNRGGHAFEDVTVSSGMDVNNNRFSFDCLWNDYNRDGWLDLYVVNDFGRKQLYRNNGNGVFTDVSAEANVEDPGEGMSATLVDYDNDGNDDLYVVNMWETAGLRITTQPEFLPAATPDVRRVYTADGMGNTLLHNSGAAGNFSDVTEDSGARVGGWNWGSGAWDADHDGYPDIYIANGFISGQKREDVSGFYWRQVAARSLDSGGQSKLYSDAWSAINEFIRSDYTWSGYQRNNFYLNNRNGTFTEAAGVLGLDCIEDSRSFAFGDFDGDGRLEVVLKNRTAPQLRLLQNRLNGLDAAIAFSLKGTQSNRDAVGAEVEVHGPAGSQRKSVWAGSGFLSQNSKVVHFGLGAKAGPVSAVVTWPGGTKQTFDNLPSGHRIEIQEGSADFKAIPFRVVREYAKVSNAQLRDAIPAARHSWLVEPIAPPSLSLKGQDGKIHSLDDAKGHAQLLVFLTTGCDESRSFLLALEEAHSRLSKSGLQVLSVLVNAGGGLASGLSSMHRQLPFPVLAADPETAGVYNIFYRYLFDRRLDLPFPISFLLDAEGNAVKVYRGSVTAAQVLEDALNIPAEAQDRLKRALPFPGRYYRSGLHHNYFTYGVAYLQFEYVDQALLAFQRSIERNPSYAAAYYNVALIYLNKGAFEDARTNLEKTVELDPANADAWNNLGVVAGQNGDYDAARRDFQHALDLQPAHLLAIQNMVKLYRFQGRADDAEALLKKAIAVDPSQAELHQGLAMLYVDQKELDAAKSEFEEAVRLSPGDVEMLNGLGVVLMQLGASDKAMEYFKQCRQLAPDYDRPYLNMAVLYLNAGEPRKAHDLLSEFLAKQPDNQDIRQALQEVDGKK